MLTRRAIISLPALLAASTVLAQEARGTVLLSPEEQVNGEVAGFARRLAGFGVHVRTAPGGGPVRNVGRLLQRAGAEIAVVPADVLGYLRQSGLYPETNRVLRYISTLYNAPV